VVLWWGIGLVAGSVVFSDGLMALAATVYSGGPGGSVGGIDQAILSVVMTVTQAVNRSAPFIGAALIGASVVMFYLAKNLLPATERPAPGDAETAGFSEAGPAS
jgi:hypothetical protein